ncbi:uncharacterized protein SETTUDRAFT_164405 [Exserohilum turcica Et28A]|uniref:Uncharacterized protein n=1 Tax=Exserohilum turcicum (strain 28A) TaxID=671987 RepID=R0IGM9_EXST2|nr:uncharacterized protein SETTUDRAFT_164405 [Exserohilum turcica Et28A]EOA84136.1 hypothetical protein SETTUDRAFT_164405 [Exserohilum turcica Et28A]
MKLSIAIAAAIASVVSAADYWYLLHVEPCQNVIVATKEFKLAPNEMRNVGTVLNRAACKVRLVSVSPGVNPNTVYCMTYRDGNNAGTPLFKGGQSMENGKTVVSPPFRGLFCGGGDP